MTDVATKVRENRLRRAAAAVIADAVEIARAVCHDAFGRAGRA